MVLVKQNPDYYVSKNSPLHHKLSDIPQSFEVNISQIKISGTSFTVITESRDKYENNAFAPTIRNLKGKLGCGPALHYRDERGTYSIVEIVKGGETYTPITIALHPGGATSGKTFPLETYYFKKVGNNFNSINDILNTIGSPEAAEVGIEEADSANRIANDFSVHIGLIKFGLNASD